MVVRALSRVRFLVSVRICLVISVFIWVLSFLFALCAVRFACVIWSSRVIGIRRWASGFTRVGSVGSFLVIVLIFLSIGNGMWVVVCFD